MYSLQFMQSVVDMCAFHRFGRCNGDFVNIDLVGFGLLGRIAPVHVVDFGQ